MLRLKPHPVFSSKNTKYKVEYRAKRSVRFRMLKKLIQRPEIKDVR